MLIQKYSIDEHEILPPFFSLSLIVFEESDGENSTNPDYETKFTYIVTRYIAISYVLPRSYRVYKIKYMYIAAKATLNTGNDHLILLFVNYELQN